MVFENEVIKHPKYNFWCLRDGTEVTKDGDKVIRNQPSNRYLRKSVGDRGTKCESVHRLVYETLIGEIPKGMVINHKDGNRKNNLISNLEVVTPSENTRHALENKLLVPNKGEEHWSAIIDDKTVLKIYDRIKNLYNNDEIASEFNLKFKHVSLIRYGTRWSHLFKEHFSEVIPSSGVSLSRDNLVEMLYLSYFTKETNAYISRKFNFDASNVSKIRNGHSYLWFLENKELIKELYFNIKSERHL